MSFHDSAMRWNGWGPRDDALSEAQWRWLAGRLAMPALLATPPRALADIALPPPRLTDAAWTHFRRFGDVRQDPHSRAAHAAGRGLLDMLRLRAGDVGTAPDAVISPKCEDDVLALLKLCAELDIAVVPFGGGTSLVGGVTPRVGHHKAVISLDMRGMARVLAVDALVGLATVEAGISGPELERQLGAHGMTLGHHPGSFAFSTLGGWIAHNGAGQDMAAHGRARDWLAGVRMATPQGLFTARAADAGGPGLVHIALGSEGTLGVITAATVRVSALPAQEDHRRYVFADFTRGLEAIRRAVQDGVPHSMLRLSDACETAFARDMARAGRRFDLARGWEDLHLGVRGFGNGAVALTATFRDRVARQQFDRLARRLGGMARGIDRGWPERRFAFGYRRDLWLDRGLGVDMIDTTASWSDLPALHRAVSDALDQAMRDNAARDGARGVVLAHAAHGRSDGASLNFVILYARKLDSEMEQVLAIRHAGMTAIAAQGAAFTHCHGVGEDHLAWMPQDGAQIAVLRGIKQALDPSGIMNPGKLIS